MVTSNRELTNWVQIFTGLFFDVCVRIHQVRILVFVGYQTCQVPLNALCSVYDSLSLFYNFSRSMSLHVLYKTVFTSLAKMIAFFIVQCLIIFQYLLWREYLTFIQLAHSVSTLILHCVFIAVRYFNFSLSFTLFKFYFIYHILWLQKTNHIRFMHYAYTPV